MKVFISWSGERSKKVAELLSSWLKCVLQASKPWLSSDMDRGVVWFSTINEALADTSTGIVCLTAENLNSPWILFETGSLSNGLTDKRVCTFLIDLKPADVEPPLSQFNHTEPNKTSMLSLVKTINSRLGEKQQIETETLDTVFNTYFPQFEKQFNDILTNTEASKGISTKSTTIRSEQDMLEEVLIAVRSLSQRVRKMESSLPNRTWHEQNARFSINKDTMQSIMNQYENYILSNQTIKDEADFNRLVRLIAEENGMPLTVARDLIYQCTSLKESDYKDFKADSMSV